MAVWRPFFAYKYHEERQKKLDQTDSMGFAKTSSQCPQVEVKKKGADSIGHNETRDRSICLLANRVLRGDILTVWTDIQFLLFVKMILSEIPPLWWLGSERIVYEPAIDVSVPRMGAFVWRSVMIPIACFSGPVLRINDINWLRGNKVVLVRWMRGVVSVKS